MNIRQLETLYWAVRLGSFAAAAERLNATQSTVSMRIQELEAEFGIALFDRTRRTAQVTPKGREMAEHAEDILARIAAMRERIAASGALPGLMRIGVAEAVSASWLPDFLRQARARFPAIAVEIEEALTRDLTEGLAAGRLDMAFIAGDAGLADAVSMPLGEVEMAWVAAADFPLPDTGGRPLGPADLETLPLIALAPASYHHAEIERWFTAGGARFRKTYGCNSLATCLQLAGNGLGLALVPPALYDEAIRARRLRVLDVAPAHPPVPFSAVYRDRTLGPAARTLGALARDASTFG